MFGQMMIEPVVQVDPGVDLQIAVAALTKVADSVEIVRWIELPWRRSCCSWGCDPELGLCSLPQHAADKIGMEIRRRGSIITIGVWLVESTTTAISGSRKEKSTTAGRPPKRL